MHGVLICIWSSIADGSSFFTFANLVSPFQVLRFSFTRFQSPPRRLGVPGVSSERSGTIKHRHFASPQPLRTPIDQRKSSVPLQVCHAFQSVRPFIVQIAMIFRVCATKFAPSPRTPPFYAVVLRRSLLKRINRTAGIIASFIWIISRRDFDTNKTYYSCVYCPPEELTVFLMTIISIGIRTQKNNKRVEKLRKKKNRKRLPHPPHAKSQIWCRIDQ